MFKILTCKRHYRETRNITELIILMAGVSAKLYPELPVILGCFGVPNKIATNVTTEQRFVCKHCTAGLLATFVITFYKKSLHTRK